jgi:hypothetical protein
VATMAEKTDPALWERVKRAVTQGGKGGRPGQWSARKAQMAVAAYKAQGGGYRGGKTKDNHLVAWTREAWGTRSGRKSGETGERYLPRRARSALTDDEYRRTTRKKQADTAKGKQFSRQPKPIARKTAAYRIKPTAGTTAVDHSELETRSRAALLALARSRKIVGRSRMRKDALVAVLS